MGQAKQTHRPLTYLLMGALLLHPSYMIAIIAVTKKIVEFCLLKPSLIWLLQSFFVKKLFVLHVFLQYMIRPP